jgi:molybdopterin-containing oxidoreductase family membrane subunit
MYAGTLWDWSMFIGTIGLFCAMLFLFVRLLPVIAIFEMRELVKPGTGGSREECA